MNTQVKRRFTEHGQIGKPITLAADHPAAVEGRTIFPTRVFDSSTQARLLKRGEHQRKIGSHVAKGRWAGMPIYTLTLEERATCPRSCKEWLTCYGSHMQAAPRIRPDERFLDQLDGELYGLSVDNLGGFVVRLHILGDFFSPGYVAAWGGVSQEIPAAAGLRLHGAHAQRRDRPRDRPAEPPRAGPLAGPLFQRRCVAAAHRHHRPAGAGREGSHLPSPDREVRLLRILCAVLDHREGHRLPATLRGESNGTQNPQRRRQRRATSEEAGPEAGRAAEIKLDG